jgi:hypothetical protein
MSGTRISDSREPNLFIQPRLYSPVVISIVGGILVPFLIGARDFDWLMSSFALTLFLTLLLAGLQPYIAKHLVAPRLAWCNELTSIGVTSCVTE